MSSHDSALRKHRAAHGLSLEALAQKAGVSTATVYRAEHERHKTLPETWDALAAALGVARAELTGHDDEDRTPATNGQGGNDDGARRDTLAGESTQRAQGGA